MKHFMKEWTQQLLHDLTTVPIPGVPGTIVVYGEQACPILTPEDPSHVILAAAAFGEGRILVTSHDGYLKHFINNDNPAYHKLNENWTRWLTKGQQTRAEVEDLAGLSAVPVLGPASVLAWDGAKDKDAKFYTDLLALVRKGRGLLIGMCPWGYLQLNPGRKLSDMPLYPILKEVGMCYTEHYYGGPKPLPTKENQADKVHFMDVMNKLTEDLNAVEPGVARIFIQGVGELPQDVQCLLAPRLKRCLDQHQERLKACLPLSKDKPCKGVDQVLFQLYLTLLELQPDKCTKAPGIDAFPGDFETKPVLAKAKVTVLSSVDDFHPTGYYLPAGVSATITVISGDPTNWSLRIGCHSDDVTTKKEWKRWPNICTTVPLGSSEDTGTRVWSPFGGLVYLQGPANGGTLQIEMDQVAEAPYFDLCDSTSIAAWPIRRQAAAPWADLVGRHVILTLPLRSIQHHDPKSALEFWDSVWEAHCDLRGIDPASRGRQWIVPDLQPSVGYMHAGRPVVTHMDVAEPGNDHFVLNAEKLSNSGSWGHFHELGHNVQRGEWTFEGTGEVTCNIFTLHAMDTVCGEAVWIHSWLQGQLKGAKNYLDEADFSQWQNSPGVALFVYAQLARCFGWRSYKQVFRQYENSEPSEQPGTFQEKVDQWIIRFSNVVERNLLPLFEFWRFPFSDLCKESLKDLQCFLPDDELTQHAASRTQSILNKCRNVDREGWIV